MTIIKIRRYGDHKLKRILDSLDSSKEIHEESKK